MPSRPAAPCSPASCAHRLTPPPPRSPRFARPKPAAVARSLAPSPLAHAPPSTGRTATPNSLQAAHAHASFPPPPALAPTTPKRSGSNRPRARAAPRPRSLRLANRPRQTVRV
nr:uncharacterized protein LOC127339584 [Lolium perenne]